MIIFQTDADKPATKEEEEFWMARGRAISSFATVESTVCQVFGAAAKLSPEAADAIFFAFISMPTRLDLLKTLLELNHGTKYSEFWTGADKAIRGITKQRNKVVHWQELSKKGSNQVVLGNANFTEFEKDLSIFDLKAVRDFTEDCHDIAKAIAPLALVLKLPPDCTAAGTAQLIARCQSPFKMPAR